ncbi:MAG: histidine phosphatase family protein [Alphaproteobacteria bacterium]|nr:histidine phosphatase family protein [Alphaproteobacteria bacterium]
MRKDFFVFRHGQTDYNLANRWQGSGIDADLNETGLAQAESLAEKVKDLGIEKIYSSPLRRAYQTATAVAKKTNAPIEIMNELTEGSVGACEGLFREDVQKKYPDIWADWYGEKMNMETRWPGGESKGEIQDRMFVAFNKMIKTNEKVIGVASHGAAIRYFLVALGYGPHKMENTALFHIIYNDGKWVFDKVM